MNKRGHIPTYFLLIGAIVLVISALFSFAIFENNSEKLSGEISEVIREVEFKQAYIEKIFELSFNEATLRADKGNFIESFKSEFLEEVEGRSFGDDRFGNFFVKIERGEFEVFEDLEEPGTYIVEIEDVFVDSSFGVNELRRVFDLSRRV